MRYTCKGKASERREFGAVGEVLVYFIGEDGGVLFNGDITDGGQLVGGEDFSERVVPMQWFFQSR